MLFDLRSRGRRRSVKVIYSGLAMLMGLALIFLGVGGFGGNVFESISREGHGNNSYTAKTAAAKKRVKQNPNDASAWAAFAEAQLHEASGGENYNTTTETYTSQGKVVLRRAANSWNRYLQLNPNHPSLKLAREVTNIFSGGALNEPANAVQALQILIAGEPPKATLYSALAEYAYYAHNNRQAELASKKALALLPPSKRPQAELQFERVKKAASTPPSGAAGAPATEAGAPATGAAGTTGAPAAGATSATRTSSTASGKKK